VKLSNGFMNNAMVYRLLSVERSFGGENSLRTNVGKIEYKDSHSK